MTDEELEKLKEHHARQIKYLNSRIPVEGLQAMLSPSEIVDFREYERRVEIRKKQELKEAFEAARISECAVFESNSVRTSGASKFLGLKYKTFDDWYETRVEKL